MFHRALQRNTQLILKKSTALTMNQNAIAFRQFSNDLCSDFGTTPEMANLITRIGTSIIQTCPNLEELADESLLVASEEALSSSVSTPTFRPSTPPGTMITFLPNHGGGDGSGAIVQITYGIQKVEIEEESNKQPIVDAAAASSTRTSSAAPAAAIAGASAGSSGLSWSALWGKLCAVLTSLMGMFKRGENTTALAEEEIHRHVNGDPLRTRTTLDYNYAGMARKFTVAATLMVALFFVLRAQGNHQKPLQQQ